MHKMTSKEERLQAIIDCSRIGTWEWNIQTGETEFNEAWAKIVGYTLDELAPISIKTWEKLAHQDDLETSGKLLERHFSGELSYYDFESRMRHKDGHWVWVHDRGKVVSWSDDGKPILMIGSHDDITDRKKIEQSLEENAILFSGIFDSSPIGIAIVEPESQRFVRANKGFLDIVEYSEDELCEKKVSDITHPDDWKIEEKAIADRLGGYVNDYTSEKRYITKSGRIRHVYIKGNILHDKGGNLLAVANVIDITEKKISERKIEHLNKVLLAIRNVNQLITKEHDPEKLIQGACKNLTETRGYHGAWIMVQSESGAIETICSSGLGSEFLDLKKKLLSGKSIYCVAKSLSEDCVQVIDSPVDICGDCPLNNQYSNLSAMSITLKYGETIYGILSVSIPADLAHDESEKSLLLEVADDIALALHNLQAEEKARIAAERESILAEMLDIAPSSITIHDTCGNFLFANQKTYSLHGYTKDEYMKINLHELDVPESEELLAERFRLIEQYGEAGFEVEHFRKDGSFFPLEIFAKQIVWEGKNAVLSIATDITERKNAEESLKESDLRFHKMLNAVPDMISIHDPDLNIVFSNWNGFAAVEHGKRKLGTKCHLTYRGYDKICPDCKAKQVLNTNEPFQEELKLPDGSWYNIRVFPIPDTKGDPYLFVEWVQDITLRKNSEVDLAAEKERLIVTLQSIGDGVITTDTNGNIVLMNKTAEEMTGWSSSEARGRPLEEVFNIINEITREQCENPVTKVLSSGHVVELANHTSLVTRDNRELIIADSAAPIKNALNETIGVVLVFRDMTEKQKFLEIVQNSQKLDSLGILAGGIAHDFNNLLGGIFGYIDMAIESSDVKIISSYLSKAITTIERARDLTRQLLTFAKGGAPVQKVEKLFPFVQETALFALSGSNVTCNFDVPQDLWTCNFDRNQIGQVIDNLIINSQQAMPAGGTISVTARNITLSEKMHPILSEGKYVKLSIKDSGIGIPPDMLPRIFDPFFTTKEKGHGLGLATCYSIITRHNGCIDVDSWQGKGSVFHIYLPASDKMISSAEKKSAGRHKGSGIFLVMDDEKAMLEIIRSMLESFGYSVVCKENGRDAVDYLASEIEANRSISGMIFDMTIPGGMGGKEAIAEIRKLNADIPAFVASGYADGPVMKNPVEYGFTASISKPFRRIELMEMLEKYITPKGGSGQ